MADAPRSLRHVDRRPVPVHRLDDAVADGERGEDPERRRDPEPLPCWAAAGDPACERQRAREQEQPAQDHGDEERQARPEPEADEHRDEHRRECRPEPQQGVEVQDRAVRALREERGRERVERRHREPEPDAEARRREQQHEVRQRPRADEELAHEQQGHREQVAGQPDEQQPLRPHGAGEPRPGQRRDDRGDGLGQEQPAIRGARQVVPVRAGEDRARGRERDQRHALREAGRIHGGDLAAIGHGGHGARTCGQRARARQAVVTASRPAGRPRTRRGDRASGRRRGWRWPSRSAPGSPRRCWGRSSCRRRTGCRARAPCS